MKVLKLSALMLGATLFTGIGATTLSAKCGGAKEEKTMKCGAGKCGSEKKDAAKSDSEKKDAAKGDSEKKEPKKAMKCGAGKCG